MLVGHLHQVVMDFTSTIRYQDQFGNIGSGSVTVNVFANQAPRTNI